MEILLHDFPPIFLTDQDIAYLLLFIQICWKLQDQDGLQFLLQALSTLQIDFSGHPDIQNLLSFLTIRFTPSVFTTPPTLPLPSSLTLETLSTVFPPAPIDLGAFSLDSSVEVIHLSSQSCWNLVLEKLVECVRDNALGTRFQFVFPDSFTTAVASLPSASQNSIDSDSAVVIPLQPSDEQSVSSQKDVLPLTPWSYDRQKLASSSSVPLTESSTE